MGTTTLDKARDPDILKMCSQITRIHTTQQPMTSSVFPPDLSPLLRRHHRSRPLVNNQRLPLRERTPV